MSHKLTNMNVKNLQSFEKKKVEMNNTLNVELKNALESDEASIPMENIKKENEKTPTKNKCDNNLQITNCSNEKKAFVSNSSNKVTRSAKKSLIRIRKIEDLCKTPIKKERLKNSVFVKEESCSPIHYTPSILTTHTAEWSFNNTQEVQGISTPIKRRKSYFEQSNSPSKRSKRQISDSDEYNEFLNSMKAELHDDTDHIEMLHDLDFMMEFDEIKITPTFLSSTTNDVQYEDNIEISKDSEVDPLSIDKDDKYDIVIKNKKENVQPTYHLITRNRSKSMELHNMKLNETPSGIKIALGDLDMPSVIKDEELSENDRKKLCNLKVQLTHDVPPQHKVQCAPGARSLTTAERNLFLQYASLRKGVFLPCEDEIIKNNWKTFCQVHDWNPNVVTPFIGMKNENGLYIKSSEERAKFVQYLANGLPCRSTCSVFQRFKTLFNKSIKSFGRYSPAEDEIILSYMKKYRRRRKNTNHFFTLSKMLGRDRHSIFSRYRTLLNMQTAINKKPRTEVQWTLELIGKFIKILLDLMLCDNVRELKDAIIPKPIWLQMEKKLNINFNVLRGFWICRLHMQLFCPESIYLNDIRIKLIEFVYGKGISNTREIIWPNVARYFDGITSNFLCQTFFHMVQYVHKRAGIRHVPDVIEYLYDIRIPELRNGHTDKFLPRFSYKNGSVEIIDKNEAYK
ncbi:uncharacterized protein LOC144469057 isoform X2 [Augochlora pura]